VARADARRRGGGRRRVAGRRHRGRVDARAPRALGRPTGRRHRGAAAPHDGPRDAEGPGGSPRIVLTARARGHAVGPPPDATATAGPVRVAGARRGALIVAARRGEGAKIERAKSRCRATQPGAVWPAGARLV
jgi:hypothetical protein